MGASATPNHPIAVDALIDAALDCRDQGVLCEAIERLAHEGLLGRCRECGSAKRVPPLDAKYDDGLRPVEVTLDMRAAADTSPKFAAALARAARRTGATRWA